MYEFDNINQNVLAWYIDEEQNDHNLQNELKPKNPIYVKNEDLLKLGLVYSKLYKDKLNEEIEKLCSNENYKFRDEIIIKEGIERFDEIVDTLSTEHIHSDDEIRYIIDGSGYFDVRDKNDKWIRIYVTKGDILLGPEGIYHRFSVDKNKYIHLLRLFKDEPKWIAFNKPCDEHESRKKYINKFYN